MNKEFIPYEQALVPNELFFELRELGIEPIYLLSKGEMELGILYSSAFRWFREKYDLDSYIYYDKVIKFYTYFICEEGFEELYDTYEEAELACLKKLIEIVKPK